MGVDIKLPIGLLFTIFGALLTVYGMVTAGDTAFYAKSLGININLYSGIFMLVFGLLMLFLSRKSKKEVES
jgi:hypothetical protein